MNPSFGAKRKARKIGHDADDEDVAMGGTSNTQDGKLLICTLLQCISDFECSGLTASVEPVSAVVRPQLASRMSSKTKINRATVKKSFGPSGTSMVDDDDEETTSIFVPKKSSLSRQALEKSALQKSSASSAPSARTSTQDSEDDRPSYSAAALSELRSSTPVTPKELALKSDIEPEMKGELDLAAKFGSNLAFQSNSAIPTASEIKEKKERRARLAKEQEFISLDNGEDPDGGEDSEASSNERSLLPYAHSKTSKKEETRLVRDDEDIAEGFDEFVDDGRIALGKKAEKEQRRRHAEEMRTMINEAEGGSGSDKSSEDESEFERKAAYEAAQTRAGMDGLKKGNQGVRPRRPQTPPKITPIPTLAGIAEKLEGELTQKRYAVEQKRRRLEEVRKELADIATRKVELQKLLDEAAETYQRLAADAGMLTLNGSEKPLIENGNIGDIADLRAAGQGGASGMGLGMSSSRGLESLGDT